MMCFQVFGRFIHLASHVVQWLETYDYDPSYKGGNKYTLADGSEATEPDAEVLDVAYNGLVQKLKEKEAAQVSIPT
jgi:hypothetical protein